MGKILLFYKYVSLEDPSQYAQEHRSLCVSLGIKGRVIFAEEGINGTVGGSEDAIEAYKTYMNEHSFFNAIDFKESVGDERYFPRLRIMVKKEIVNLGIDPKILSAEDRGEYVSPREAHALMEKPADNFIVLDVRNKYETEVGTFTDAIIPNTRYFREFPDYIDQHLDLFKDKEVLMTCTGGVRCERASAYLKSKGVAKKVMHLKGGIHRYIEQFPDGHFRGSNYVFDARITEAANKDVLGVCIFCKISTDYYENCKNAFCNKHFLTCLSCKDNFKQCCSQHCLDLITEGKVIVRTKEARVTL